MPPSRWLSRIHPYTPTRLPAPTCRSRNSQYACARTQAPSFELLVTSRPRRACTVCRVVLRTFRAMHASALYRAVPYRFSTVGVPHRAVRVPCRCLPCRPGACRLATCALRSVSIRVPCCAVRVLCACRVVPWPASAPVFRYVANAHAVSCACPCRALCAVLCTYGVCSCECATLQQPCSHAASGCRRSALGAHNVVVMIGSDRN